MTTPIPLDWTDEELAYFKQICPDDKIRRQMSLIFEQKYQHIAHELRTSEARYKAIIDVQEDLVCRYAPDTTLTYVNEAYARYHNIPPEKLVGTSFLDLLPNPERQRAQAVVNDMLENPRILKNMFPATNQTGEHRWYHWSDTPILNTRGEVIEIQTVGRDVTMMQELHLATQQSQQQLRMIVDHFPMGAVIMFDTDMRYTLVAGGAIEKIGITPQGYEGNTVEEVQAEDVAQALRPIYKRALKGETFETEFAFGTYEYNVRATPVYDGAGNTVGGLLVVDEVTERKALQEEHLKLELEQERRRIITNFIRDASHEFRTPLTIIQSSVYIARKSENLPKIYGRLDKIEAQVANLTQLVDTLVLMARLDGTSQTYDKWSADVQYDLRGILEHMTSQLAERDLRVNWQNLPEITANHHDITIALQEIIENAVTHTTEGDSITIDFAVHDAENTLEISTRDTGQGIDANLLPKVWERFTRGDDAHLTRGLGLGLPIAKRIVELHSGTITIESAPQKGTQVTICLPLK
jgi:PAS domain S-box-containing protein